MTTEFYLFLAGQAVVLVGVILATYIRTAVKLNELSVRVKHVERLEVGLKKQQDECFHDMHIIANKLTRIETLQQTLCNACPLRNGNGNNPIIPPRKKRRYDDGSSN